MKLNDWVTGLLFFVVFYSINQLEVRFVTQTSQFSLSKSFVVKASSHVGIAKVGGTKITRANDQSTVAGVSDTFRCWRSSSLIHLHLGSWWGPEIRVSFWFVFILFRVYEYRFFIFILVSNEPSHIIFVFEAFFIFVIVFYIKMTSQQSTDFDRGKSRLARSTRSDTVSLIRQARICQSKCDEIC